MTHGALNLGSCARELFTKYFITALRHFQYHPHSQGDSKHFIKLPHVPCVELSTEWAKL